MPPDTESNTPLLDLFGEPIAAAQNATTAASTTTQKKSPRSPSVNGNSKADVIATPPSPAALAAAQKLSAFIHLGTSSWSYAGWNGLLYDGAYAETKLAREGLGAYSAHPLLRTVGIDRTFYAPIAERDYQHYASQVPSHFRFLVKAPMAITSSYVRSDDGKFSDSPFFLDAHYAIDEFIAPCTAGLGSKLGPMVFQFPPQGRQHTHNPDAWINNLYRFLRRLPPGFLYAVEIRDTELLTHRFFMCLKTAGVKFCIASHAKMPNPSVQIAAMNAVMEPGALVARWSLHSGFKYADAKARYFPFNQLVDPDLDSRASLATAALAAVEAGYPAFVIVNNKAEGSAPLSIEALAAHIVSPPQ
jgi:uncharacterized protein YecE (DUF72 family)